MPLDGATLLDCASARARASALIATIALGVFATARRGRQGSAEAYADTLIYVFGNAYGFWSFARIISLLLTALAAALPARIGLINVGAEGQLYMGPGWPRQARSRYPISLLLCCCRH